MPEMTAPSPSVKLAALDITSLEDAISCVIGAVRHAHMQSEQMGFIIFSCGFFLFSGVRHFPTTQNISIPSMESNGENIWRKFFLLIFATSSKKLFTSILLIFVGFSSDNPNACKEFVTLCGSCSQSSVAPLDFNCSL